MSNKNSPTLPTLVQAQKLSEDQKEKWRKKFQKEGKYTKDELAVWKTIFNVKNNIKTGPKIIEEIEKMISSGMC